MTQVPPLADISAPPSSYEAAVAELEQLAEAMESGELPLNDMLTGYRRASFLLNYCRGLLDTVESQIRQLEDGQLKPWQPQPPQA